MSKFKTRVQGLLCPDINTIWIYGKKFVQFDTLTIAESGKLPPTHLDMSPIFAEVNAYYQQIIVVNK